VLVALPKLNVTVPVVAVTVIRFVAPADRDAEVDVQVTLTPAVLKLKEPPATIGADTVFLKDNTVALTSMFTVKLLVNTSSALVGTTPVFQVAPALQFPFVIAYTFAISKRKYALNNLSNSPHQQAVLLLLH
jgi:hypothetical protein